MSAMFYCLRDVLQNRIKEDKQRRVYTMKYKYSSHTADVMTSPIYLHFIFQDAFHCVIIVLQVSVSPQVGLMFRVPDVGVILPFCLFVCGLWF